MKALIMLLTMSTSFSALAGSAHFTCKNKENSIVITRNNLVKITTDKDTLQSSVTILESNDENQFPGQTQVFEFNNQGSNVASLKFNSISPSKTIASDQGTPCDGGHGPGFSTVEYNVSGQLTVFDRTEFVQLTCTESNQWSGSCGKN